MKFYFFLLASILCTTLKVNAQRPKPTSTTIKFKAPKLTTTLANFKDTSFVSAQTADSIIRLAIKVTDAKKQAYTLVAYQFLYKQIVTTENEETGKTSKVAAIKSSLFKTSPLPNLWLNVITENLKKGEEFFFFDVIVKDPEGRNMYAPNLKLIIE